MMKLALASVAMATTVSADALTKLGEVFVITDANADDFLAENKDGTLVKFYAPWCGHCKSMAPAYDEAAKKLEADGSKIPLAKCDATVEKGFPGKHSVSGYPTLKWFVDGSGSEYDGPRDADGIVNWIKSMSGPAVVEGVPAEDAAFTITYYGSEASEAFNGAAKKARKAAAWHFVNLEGETKIVFQHKSEPAIEVAADLDQEALEKEMKKNQFPLYGSMDGNSYGKYIEAGTGLIWVLMPMTKETVKEVVEASREKMTEVANKLGADNFKVTYTNTEEFKAVLENMFGVKELGKGRVVVQLKGGDKKKFVYDGEMEIAPIVEYVNKCKSGEIVPELKSQEPKEDVAGEVKIVVGKDMKERLFKENQDVLFEAYAPWCGHCKRLDPEYLKVAKKIHELGMEDKIAITKMDGTENDSAVDEIDWSGFPTIIFIKAGEKKHKSYAGGRDYDGIMKWLGENAKHGDELKKALEKGDDKADDDLDDDKDDKEEL